MYTELLNKRYPQYGHALWYSEPPRRGNRPSIFEREGSFLRLFNVLVGPTHDLNSEGVPDGFEPFPSVEIKEHTISPRMLYSEGVEFHEPGRENLPTSVGFLPKETIPGNPASPTFTCTARGGAFLMLRSHSLQTYMKPTHEFTEYIFAINHNLPLDEVVLVRGTTMASSWDLGVIYGHEDGFKGYMEGGIWGEVCDGIGLGLGRMSVDDVRFEHAYEKRIPHEEYLWVRSRGNLNPIPDDENRPKTHCMFINYYKLKQRLFHPDELVANMDFSSSPCDDSDIGDNKKSTVREDHSKRKEKSISSKTSVPLAIINPSLALTPVLLIMVVDVVFYPGDSEMEVAVKLYPPPNVKLITSSSTRV
ncbi:hypothetical protein BDY19DRAFT_910036 [Irpex rosettiformis]|uniref:Uncharacterized protein n=1 Tax=Irpex rosettiformis TaxID=378272 RepID=A0ACB8TQ87_9APHY|nr:hypothetical protein BDY19DRAFT_910036 [Irpex rosettiformis]